MKQLLAIGALVLALLIPGATSTPAADCGGCCLDAIMSGLVAYSDCMGHHGSDCIGELISAQYNYAASNCASCNCELP